MALNLYFLVFHIPYMQFTHGLIKMATVVSPSDWVRVMIACNVKDSGKLLTHTEDKNCTLQIRRASDQSMITL